MLGKGDFKVKTIRQKELLPLHLLLGKVESSLVRSLPAGHALTGCDTVSKVGTKLALLKALKQYSHFIMDFGLNVLDKDMFEKAEQFLVKVVANKAFMNCATFDELRLRMRQQIRNVRFVDLPCSSNEIRLHVRRAYFQARLWLEAGTGDASQILDVTEYGYDSNLSPTWFVPPQRPLDIPEPCKCKSCVRITCPCRQKQYACSHYCKCREMCKNPINNAN